MTNLADLDILSDEYDLFCILNDDEKIEFLFDALTIGVSDSIIKQLQKTKSDIYTSNIGTSQDLTVGPNRLCICIINGVLTLNSDNLRVLRSFVRKFFHDGYILSRNNIIKKEKDFDIYKYFKAYNVCKTGMPICEN